MTIPVDFSSNATRVAPGVNVLAGNVERVGRNAAAAQPRVAGVLDTVTKLGLAAVGIGGLAQAFNMATRFVDGLAKRAEDAASKVHDLRVQMESAAKAGREAELGRMADSQGMAPALAGFERGPAREDRIAEIIRERRSTASSEVDRERFRRRERLERSGLGEVTDMIDLGLGAQDAVAAATARRGVPEQHRERFDEGLRASTRLGADPQQAMASIAEALSRGPSGAFGSQRQEWSTRDVTAVGVGRDVSDREFQVARRGRAHTGLTDAPGADLAIRQMMDVVDPASQRRVAEAAQASARDAADPVAAAQREVIASMEKNTAALEARAKAENELIAVMRDMVGFLRGRGNGSSRGQAAASRDLVNAARSGGY